MIRYVAGFMFNLDKTKLALIRKNRPEWQKGFLNGIGGKIDGEEHSFETMTREFEEETGYKTYWYDWWPLVTLKGQKGEWEVDVFYAMKNVLSELKNMTDESIEIIDVANIDNEKVLSNIPWLIKMCFDNRLIYGEIKCKS